MNQTMTFLDLYNAMRRIVKRPAIWMNKSDGVDIYLTVWGAHRCEQGDHEENEILVTSG